MEVSNGNGTVESSDCEAHYTKLHGQNCIELHTHANEFMHN